MSDTNAADCQWPEDIAVIEWAKIHCPELEYADLHPLSKAVTAYRIEVQKENDALRAQLSEAQARLAEIERQEPAFWYVPALSDDDEDALVLPARDGRCPSSYATAGAIPLYAAPVSPAAQVAPDVWLYHWPETGQRSISKRRLEPGVGAGDEYACYRADDGRNQLAREYADDGLLYNGQQPAAQVAQGVSDDLIAAIERLLEASAYIGESQHLGEENPWDEVRALLAAAQQQKDSGNGQ